MEPTSTEITLLSKIFANTSTEDTVHNKEDIDHLEDQNNLENLETLRNLQILDDSIDLEDLEDLEDLPIRLDTLPIIVLRQIFKVLSFDRYSRYYPSTDIQGIVRNFFIYSFYFKCFLNSVNV